jgi:hypothetical protein
MRIGSNGGSAGIKRWPARLRLGQISAVARLPLHWPGWCWDRGVYMISMGHRGQLSIGLAHSARSCVSRVELGFHRKCPGTGGVKRGA